jgi:hypothetical protein
VISREEWVLVTNNDRDFRALTRREGLHPAWRVTMVSASRGCRGERSRRS